MSDDRYILVIADNSPEINILFTTLGFVNILNVKPVTSLVLLTRCCKGNDVPK